MIVLMRLSGFFFLLILVLQILMAALGYILEPTQKHYESDAKLQKFNNNPKKFQISILLALIEHVSIIVLVIMLFIVFGPLNIILVVILVIFRIAEGSIQIYIEKDYWGLLDVAKKYSTSSGTEKDSLMDSYRTILQTKSVRFAYAMISWSIGTFAFSIILITSGVAPTFIGWLGIVASICIGIANLIKLLKSELKIYGLFSSIGGLMSIAFEILIGGWLLFFSHIIP